MAGGSKTAVQPGVAPVVRELAEESKMMVPKGRQLAEFTRELDATVKAVAKTETAVKREVERQATELKNEITAIAGEVSEYNKGTLAELLKGAEEKLSPEAFKAARELCALEVGDFIKKLEKAEGDVGKEAESFNRKVAREAQAIKQQFAKRPESPAEAASQFASQAAGALTFISSLEGRQQALLEKLKDKPAETAEELSESFKRLREGQAYLLENGNDKLFLERKKSTQILADEKYYCPWEEKGKLRDNISEMGLKFELVANGYGKEFSEAYSFLMNYFPRDELDPQVDLRTFIDANRTNSPVYKKEEKEAMSGDLYQRYYMVVARDKDGAIVGVADGNVLANKDTCAAYLAHIAVLEKHRRKDIATVLESAVIGVANRHAEDAEKELGTSYKTALKGNKVGYILIETEPANRVGEEEANLTFSRLMFHAANGGAVINGLRYAQVDLDSQKGQKFDEKRLQHSVEDEEGGKSTTGWNTVPLLLAVRKVGDEKSTAVPATEARALLNLMEDCFVSADTYNDAGVNFDRKYALEKLPASGSVELVPLPKTVEEFPSFLEKIPTMDVVMANDYASHPNAKDYLKEFKEAEKQGKTLATEAVLKMLEQKQAGEKSTISSS